MLAIVTALLAWSATAQAEATQMWKCEMEDDATEQEVTAMARNWLAAVKKVEGGERFKAYVYFPVAVNVTGQTDLMFVVVAPSFAEWGKFWDNYAGSQAAKIDELNQEKVVCPDSAVWESIALEVKAE
ncbi:MAG: hypothetical protein WBG05_02470 [Thermoanaerobaculia bacterium]